MLTSVYPVRDWWVPLRNFELFVKTVDSLPPEKIFEFLDLECKSLETDLETHRLNVSGDHFSILCFRQYVRMVKHGNLMRCIAPLPANHVKFYRETITRLIEAKELPKFAMEQFDFTFPASDRR
jgi:hypothetical protein